jgi:hypothetical protein
MNSIHFPGILAHGGGGQLSSSTLIVLGSLILLLGLGLLWNALSNHLTATKTQRGTPLFTAIFLLLFGYSFLAQGLDLPGKAEVLHVLFWLFAIPLLFLPWFLWKMWRERKKQQVNSATHPPLVGLTAEERVRSLLRPDEQLLWIGTPLPLHFLGEKIAHFLFGLIPFTFGAVFLILMAWSISRDGINPNMLPGYLVGFTAGVGFSIIGVGLLLTPWMMGSRLREVVYAITDRRGILLTSPAWFWQPIPTLELGDRQMDFTPQELLHGKRMRRGVTRFDLIFRSERRGSGKGRTTVHYGFLGLKHPEEAQNVIEATFRKDSAASISSVPTQSGSASPG